MKKQVLILTALLLCFSNTSVWAAKAPNPMQSCEALAKKIMSESTPQFKSIHLDRDQYLTEIDKYARKVGSQYVATIMRGTGVITYKEKEVEESVRFMCLLNNNQALFVDITENPNCQPQGMLPPRFTPDSFIGNKDYLPKRPPKNKPSS